MTKEEFINNLNSFGSKIPEGVPEMLWSIGGETKSILAAAGNLLDAWTDAKIDRLVVGLKPSLDLHTAALEKNAEASTLLAMRLTDFIEHQFHTTR